MQSAAVGTFNVAVSRPFAKGIVNDKSVFVIANDGHNVAEAGEISVDDAGLTLRDRAANIGGSASKGQFILQSIGFCEFRQILRFVATETSIVHVSIQLIFKLHGIRFAGNLEIVHDHGKTGHIAGSARIIGVVELRVVGDAETFAVGESERGCWGGFRFWVLDGRWRGFGGGG